MERQIKESPSRDELYNKFGTFLTRYFKKNYPSDADDLVMEVIEKAYNKMVLMQSASVESRNAWIRVVAKNHLLDHKRKIALRERHKAVLKQENNGVSAENDVTNITIEDIKDMDVDNPLEYVERLEDRKYVRNAVESLPSIHKQIIILYYYENFCVEEIAAMLNTNQGTIKSRIFRARLYLKELLKDYFEC